MLLMTTTMSSPQQPGPPNSLIHSWLTEQPMQCDDMSLQSLKLTSLEPTYDTSTTSVPKSTLWNLTIGIHFDNNLSTRKWGRRHYSSYLVIADTTPYRLWYSPNMHIVLPFTRGQVWCLAISSQKCKKSVLAIKVLYTLIFAHMVFVPKCYIIPYAYCNIWVVATFQHDLYTNWSIQLIDGSVDICNSGSTCLHCQMVCPVHPCVPHRLSNISMMKTLK